jgi:hypothetical protein
MTKAFEGDVGLTRAVEIWKELNIGKYGAEKAQSPSEAELSVKTWVNCINENHYWDNIGHYKRLNQKLLDHFWRESKNHDEEYPKLARYDGRIGKMTKAIATMDALKRVRCGATNIGKAMAINEGKKLNLNIAAEFTSKTYQSLIDQGEDPKLAANIAIEGIRVAKETQLLSSMDKTEIFRGVSDQLISILNGNPQIIAIDNKHQEIFGERDALSLNNPNCKKRKEK